MYVPNPSKMVAEVLVETSNYTSLANLFGSLLIIQYVCRILLLKMKERKVGGSFVFHNCLQLTVNSHLRARMNEVRLDNLIVNSSEGDIVHSIEMPIFVGDFTIEYENLQMDTTMLSLLHSDTELHNIAD